MHASPKPGTILWKYEIGAELWAPMKHHNGLLYMGCDDSNFYAFDISTQSVKWKFPTGGIIRSAPDIHNGILTFCSDDGYLYALDVISGKQVWKFDLESSGLERRLPATDGPYEYDYMCSSPVYDDGKLYIGSAKGTLFAINQATGASVWQFQSDGKIRTDATVVGDRVYLTSWDGHLYALIKNSGEEIWQFDTGGIIQSTPTYDNNTLFLGSRSTQLFAVNATTGELKWSYRYVGGSWAESTAVVDGNVVYFGSSDALKMTAFNKDNGKVIWEYETGGWSWGTPYLKNGVAYIGSLSAFPYYFDPITLKEGFHAVDMKTGEARWKLETDVIDAYITGGVFSSVEVVEGVVYFGALDGNIYAVKE